MANNGASDDTIDDSTSLARQWLEQKATLRRYHRNMDESRRENRAAGEVGGPNPNLRFGPKPPWAGPSEPDPRDVRFLRQTIGQSDVAKVTIQTVSYFTDGYLVDVAVRANAPCEADDDAAIRAWRNEKWEQLHFGRAEVIPDGVLRIEIHLEGGRTLTLADYIIPPIDAPEPPILREISGAGYRASARGFTFDPRLWIWPAIDYPVRFWVAWPALDIEATESIADLRWRE